jgi:hypothetical protein
MKSYFDFRCMTCCGISKVKLLGTHEDWLLLLEKVEALRQYELGWWVDALMPILQKILKTYTGEKVDKIFWYTIYKQWSTSGSGASTYVNGWITSFFPYRHERRREFSDLDELREDACSKPPTDLRRHGRRGLKGTLDYMDVPNGVSTTPFIWEYYGAEIPMTIYGGFAGCEMDGEYIRPVLAWAVGKDTAGVYKQLVSKHGQATGWTADALCEYFERTNSSFAEKASGWIQKNNMTGEQLLDYRAFKKLIENAGTLFDKQQITDEFRKLQRMAMAR